MRFQKIIGITSVVCMGALTLPAQDANQVEQLKKQLQQMQAAFEQQQRLQQQQIETLKKQLDALQQNQEMAAKLSQELKESNPAAPAPATPGAATELTKPWSPSQPIPVARAGSSYMNMSFDALMAFGWSTAADPSAQLQLGDHDPIKRGFSLRNAEIALDGAVDPYFKGFANIVLKLDKDNETSIELEEAYLQSTSLPANLQLKAGQFFSAFGRQNPQHPHQWAFVDAPIISTRAFGPDGMRSIGAQLSWLVPLPFYTEVFLGVFDGQGGTMHSFRNVGEDDGTGVNRFAGRATLDRHLLGPQDLVFTPRWASSFELGDTQTLVAGVSGAFGANDTGPHSRTEVYGADLYWKWKPANASEGFPFVSWQTEGIYRRFGAGADATAPTPLPAENIRDWGAYTQVSWGFKPHWVTGLRGEFATGNNAQFDALDPFRGDRVRVSPVLTWYLSEFSKIRLQYNYDHGQNFGDAHSVWMQLEFMLGAHSAHKF